MTMRTQYAAINSQVRLRPLVLAVASFAGFLVSLYMFTGRVSELQQKLLVQQARSAAHYVDSAISARKSAIVAAVADLQPDTLGQPGVLKDSIEAIKADFEDFRSFGVADETGRIVAMFGDIIVPQTKLDSSMAQRDIKDPNSPLRQLGWAFEDDPATHTYGVVIERMDSHGRPWYVRAKFDRRKFNDYLAMYSPNMADVRLASRAHSEVARGESDWRVPAGESAGDESVKLAGGLLSGPTMAEASLMIPGWRLLVKPVGMRWFDALGPMIMSLAVFLAVMFAGLLVARRFGGNPAPAWTPAPEPHCEDIRQYIDEPSQEDPERSQVKASSPGWTESATTTEEAPKQPTESTSTAPDIETSESLAIDSPSEEPQPCELSAVDDPECLDVIWDEDQEEMAVSESSVEEGQQERARKSLAPAHS